LTKTGPDEYPQEIQEGEHAMAEVRIDIKAEDAATPVLRAVEQGARGMAENIMLLNDSLGQSWSSTETFQALLETIQQISGQEIIFDLQGLSNFERRIMALEVSLEKRLNIDTVQAVEAIDGLGASLASIDMDKTLCLDTSAAIVGALQVKSAIDAIPDIQYKTVIVQYKTQSSPVRPFSEGMEYIRKKMESLPVETRHVIRYGSDTAAPALSPVPSDVRQQQAAPVFAPAITVNAAQGQNAEALARDLERALADRWRNNRSELRRAMAT
jgi:hypothetical protein